MRLVVEDVLGISEVGRESLQQWRTRGFIVPPVDPIDGETLWDEWCILAAIVIATIEEPEADLRELQRRCWLEAGPFNVRLRFAYLRLGAYLAVHGDGSITHIDNEGGTAKAFHLQPEFEYVREELESRHGEAAF